MQSELKIFISSPGDVGQERFISTRVIERLKGEFSKYTEIKPFLWEHEPLRATGHFQQQILLPSNTDIVICILWSRLGTRLPGDFKRTDGSLYSSGTEFEFEDAVWGHRNKGTPDLLIYRKSVEPDWSTGADVVMLERMEQKKALDGFIRAWFEKPADGFEASLRIFNTPDEFENMLEDQLRQLIIKHLPEIPTILPIKRWYQDPYRGLQAFDYEQAPVFFGRTRAIGELKDRMMALAAKGKPFAIVYGMSGCGKSSFVRAGVLPTVTQPGVIEKIGLWRRCILCPGDVREDLFSLFCNSLNNKTALPELFESEPGMAGIMRDDPDKGVSLLQSALYDCAEKVRDAENLTAIPEPRLAVVIDQMEELFLSERIDVKQRNDFAEFLVMLAKSGMAWVICTMRSDFYQRLAEIPALADLPPGSGYRLSPPDFTEIGQIIRYPTHAAGLKFDEDPTTGRKLDEVLHEAASRDTSSLPLLEFTLDGLFKAREVNEKGEEVLTFKAYDSMGGLEGAIAKRAEDTLTGLPTEIQDCFGPVMRALITVVPGSEETVAARKAAISAIAGSKESKAFIDAFVAARLMTSDSAGNSGTTVKIAHDALLRRWPRLKALIDENRDFFHLRERLRYYTLQWSGSGKKPDFLLPPGKNLSDAEDMLRQRSGELEQEITEFIRASVRKASRAKNIRRLLIVAAFGIAAAFGVFNYGQLLEERRQNSISETQLILAQNSKVKAQKSGEAAARDAETAALKAGIAQEKQKEAKDSANNAEKLRLDAEAQSRSAEQNRLLAVQKRDEALNAEKRAEDLKNQVADSLYSTLLGKQKSIQETPVAQINESRALAKLSLEEADSGGYVEAFRLALQALPQNAGSGDRPYVAEAEEALYNALLYRPFNSCRVFDGNDSTVNQAILSQNGSVLLTVTGYRSVKIWDAKNTKLTRVLLDDVYLRNADMSRDGRYAVTASNDFTARIWDLATGKEIARLKHEGYVNRAFFSRDGKFVITASDDGSAHIFDLLKGKQTIVIKNAAPVKSVALSPKDQLAATVCEDGNVDLWDVGTGKKSGTFTCSGRVTEICFSPNGRYLAALDTNHTTICWDLTTGEQVLRYVTNMLGTTKPYCLRVSNDSRYLLAVNGKTAYRWDIEKSQLDQVYNSKDWIYCADFSPDGSRIITASDDKSAIVWDANTGNSIFVLKHMKGVVNCQFADNNTVVTASKDMTAAIWDIRPNRDYRVYGSNGVLSYSFGGGGRFLTTVSRLPDTGDHYIRELVAEKWDLDTGTKLKELKVESYNSYHCLDENGGMLAVYNGNAVEIWNVDTASVVAAYKTAHIAGMSFASNGSRLIIRNSSNKDIDIIDALSGERTGSIHVDSEIDTFGLSAGGGCLYAVHQDNTVSFWDMSTLKLLSVYRGGDRIEHAAVSPVGSLAAIGGGWLPGNNEMHVWDYKKGVEIYSTTIGKEYMDFLFSPDASQIIASNYGSSALICDAKDGKVLSSITLQDMSSRTYACYDSAGSRFILNINGKEAALWDTGSGSEIARLKWQGDYANDMALSPDGRFVYMEEPDKFSVLRLWPNTRELVDYGGKLVKWASGY